MGDASLKKAIDDYQSRDADADIAVRYQPYMIDPNTQRSGEDYNAYCRRRWGGDGWTMSLKDRGRQLGLGFEGWDWWPNTLNAHRVCVYLDQMDQANPELNEKEREQRGLNLVSKFYELTYERKENISTSRGAALALEELGYASASDVEQWLDRGGGQREVAQADRHAKRDMDIHGVPYFVISGEETKRPLALSGAQSSGAFVRAFQQVQR